MEGFKNNPDAGIEKGLEEREAELSREIAEDIDELSETTEKVEDLLSDEDISPTLKEKTLEKIDDISRRATEKFMSYFGGSAVLAGVLASHQYLMEKGISVIEKGSILGDANPIALVAVGLFVSIKTLQFTTDKLRARGIKKDLDRGTVRDAREAGDYIMEKTKYLDYEDPLNEDVSKISGRLLQEDFAIHKEEGMDVNSGAYIDYKESNKRLDEVYRRVTTEISEQLRNKF